MFALLMSRSLGGPPLPGSSAPSSTNSSIEDSDDEGHGLWVFFAVLGNAMWMTTCICLCVFCWRSCLYRVKLLTGSDLEECVLSDIDRQAIPPIAGPYAGRMILDLNAGPPIVVPQVIPEMAEQRES